MTKRKTSPTLDVVDDQAHTLFASVPDKCWEIVASFAPPPAVYNLALSSNRFFRQCEEECVATGADVPISRRRSSRLAARRQSRDKRDATAPVLATRLLRQSLLSSLGRVLDRSRTGITLASALALADLPEGSAVIAGSTLAQACLGELWEGTRSRSPDVDIYSSATAAPRVRSWLVERAAGIFVGFRDNYIECTDDRLSYTVDTKIHHVEHWGSLAKNIAEDAEDINLYASSDEESVGQINKDGVGDDFETLKNTEYYKKAVAWGKNCQKDYVDWKWNHSMSFDILGVDDNQNGAYDIKPRLRGDLPFDFNGSGDIDLIVARTKNSPFDLLDDFDLTICKASFDGKSFRIPDPHRTFNKRSTMEPDRCAVIESYVKHYVPPQYPIGVGASVHVSATIEKVRGDVPYAPFYRQLSFADVLPDRYDEDAFFGRGSLHDPLVEAKHGAPIMFHNWTAKLIRRLRKYQNRGIDVIGAPAIGNDFEICELSLQHHGG